MPSLSLLCLPFFFMVSHVFRFIFFSQVCLSLLCFLFHPLFFASGLLFLLWGAVPSVSAPWLYLLLRHLLIYRSGERQAAWGRHRVATAAHIQHILTLDDRFVARCPSLRPCRTCPRTPAPAASLNPNYYFPFCFQYLTLETSALTCKVFVLSCGNVHQ